MYAAADGKVYVRGTGMKGGVWAQVKRLQRELLMLKYRRRPMAAFLHVSTIVT
jgi:hypothetical protein